MVDSESVPLGKGLVSQPTILKSSPGTEKNSIMPLPELTHLSVNYGLRRLVGRAASRRGAAAASVSQMSVRPSLPPSFIPTLSTGCVYEIDALISFAHLGRITSFKYRTEQKKWS